MNKGHVFWITGLAGAGKTTYAKKLYDYLKNENIPIVMLDGDEMRSKLFPKVGYDLESRKNLAKSYSSLCELISSQGVNVICSTISMFQSVRDFSKRNITNYHEVYIEVSIKELENRNQKSLYSNSNQTVGKEITPELPTNPHIKIINNKKSDLESNFSILLEYCQKNLKNYATKK